MNDEGVKNVAVGTVITAPLSRFIDSYKGYCMNVQFSDEAGVWMQKVQVTGNFTEDGVELIVVPEDTPIAPGR